MASTEAAPKIVLSEADLIDTMRTMLRRADRRIRDESYGSDRPQDYGRLSEAIDVAEHALFNVLNVAASYTGCVASKAIVDSNRGEQS